MRVLIESGTVVNANGQAEQDLLIEGGIVHQLGTDISPQLPCREVDVSGYYVFLGDVDVHTHLNTDVGIAHSRDDFFTGTYAAACGGTTTIIDHMGFGPSGCRLRRQLEVYRGYATHKAVIGYSFHGTTQHINHAILGEILMMVREGLSSFKLYLAYQYELNDDKVLQALRRLHGSGALTTVHLESDVAIANKRTEFTAAGLTASRYHALSRSLGCEAEAIAYMINLIQAAGGAPLYIVHLSDGLGLGYLRLARANHQPAWIETCPQYFLLDECSYDTEDGMRSILSPPLRNVREQDKLWCGVSDGAIDVVATNHRTSSMTQRLQISKGDFSHCPDGLPSAESHMQLLFSSGVTTGCISLEHFVELASIVPTRLFDLWPQKGISVPGSDGDVVIINPCRSQRIQCCHLHDNADYSSWEGFTCQGAIVGTLSRDGTISRDDTFTGKTG